MPCRQDHLCYFPCIRPLQSQLQLDSDLSDDLNQELMMKKGPHRDTAPFSAFYEGLETKWASRAQHVGPKSGDRCPVSSKMSLLTVLLPHRHKQKSEKTEASHSVLCTPGSPMQPILWVGAVAAA